MTSWRTYPPSARSREQCLRATVESEDGGRRERAGPRAFNRAAAARPRRATDARRVPGVFCALLPAFLRGEAKVAEAEVFVQRLGTEEVERERGGREGMCCSGGGGPLHHLLLLLASHRPLAARPRSPSPNNSSNNNTPSSSPLAISTPAFYTQSVICKKTSWCKS